MARVAACKDTSGRVILECMKLDDEAVQEFIRLYEEQFEEALTPDEGREMASRVLALYRALARPLPSERDDGRS